MHFMKFLKDVKFDITNKGEELILSVKGTKEQISTLEKKLKAIQELCCDDACCGGGCCGEKKEGCC